MTVDDEGTAGFSLRRWSRRKLDGRARGAAVRQRRRPLPRAGRAAPAAAAAPPAAAAAAGDAAVPAASALPPTETLTFDSDFTAYLQPKVDEAVRRTGAAHAVPRSALQRDGRPRRLHRRLLDPGSHFGGDGPRAGAEPRTSSIPRRRASTPRAMSRTFRPTNVSRRPPDAAPTPAAIAATDRRTAGAARVAARRACDRRVSPSPPLPTRPTDGARSRRTDPTRSCATIRPMSLADKNLHLCSCNGTMAIDAAALARALELAGTPAVKTMLCQKELAAFADHAAGDVVVACTQEAKLFGDIAEEGGRTQAIRFVNLRETGGWSAESRQATPKMAALLALAAMPEPDPVPRVAYASQGQLLIVGPADAALHWAGVLSAQLAVTVLATGRAMGVGAAGRARFPGLFRQAGQARRLAGRVRRANGSSRIPSTSICARAAMPACAPVPSRRSTSATRSTSSAANRTARASPRAATSAPSISSAATSPAPSASTSCSTCSARRPCACTSRRRATSRRAPIRWRRRRRWRSSPRWWASSRSRNTSATRRRSARTAARRRPAARAASTSARPPPSAPTATTSSSSRTCAWAAARARPSARRAR